MLEVMPEASPSYTILLKARDAVMRGWTQRTLARDAIGDSVKSQDPRAVGFCAIGALWHATNDERLVIYAANVLRDALTEPRDITLVMWNDNPLRTQEEVVALYDKALLQYQPKEA